MVCCRCIFLQQVRNLDFMTKSVFNVWEMHEVKLKNFTPDLEKYKNAGGTSTDTTNVVQFYWTLNHYFKKYRKRLRI